MAHTRKAGKECSCPCSYKTRVGNLQWALSRNFSTSNTFAHNSTHSGHAQPDSKSNVRFLTLFLLLVLQLVPASAVQSTQEVTISMAAASSQSHLPLEVKDFATELFCDTSVVNGNNDSGSSGPIGVEADGEICLSSGGQTKRRVGQCALECARQFQIQRRPSEKMSRVRIIHPIMDHIRLVPLASVATERCLWMISKLHVFVRCAWSAFARHRQELTSQICPSTSCVHD